jgi:hypothetical protein
MIKAFKKYIGKQLRDVKILRHHLKRVSFDKSSKKRIIVCFNGVVPHGGLVDRLKGIISFYDIAKRLDFDFYIQFNTPFSLTDFLEPNQVDWIIKDSDVTYNFRSTQIVNCINNFNFNPFEKIKNSNKSTFLIYSNIDYLDISNKNLGDINKETLWRNHFNDLFKKTVLLDTELNKVVPGSYNSFHTRFTSLMGDFKDSTSVILSIEARNKLISDLKTKVIQLKEASDKPLYAFSDSSNFLDEISNSFEVKRLEGLPFHMDNYAGGSTLEAHLKTMIDFFTIANSNHVYFIKVGKMYTSAFSKYAAIIGNKPFTKIEA